MKCERDLSKKKMIKNINSKMTRNSQLSTTEPKKKQKQTKQTTRTGIELQKWRSQEGYQWEGENGGGKVQGIRSISGRYKIDRRKLRIVWEMEKPKNLYV